MFEKVETSIKYLFIFFEASEVKRKVNRNTGEEIYKKTGINTGDYQGAERGGELLNLAVDILERACLKNLDEEIEVRVDPRLSTLAELDEKDDDKPAHRCLPCLAKSKANSFQKRNRAWRTMYGAL